MWFLCCGGSSFQRSRGRLTFPGRSTTGFSHRVLLVSQSYVAITFLTGHFPPKPPGRLEFATRCEVGEFHLGHYQTGMFTAININLDHQISPGNFIPQLAQPSSRRARPQRSKLLWAELDLAFFPMRAAANFESKRCSFALFSKPNMSASGFGSQVTLRNWIMATALQFLRELLNQKFAFNFTIVSRPIPHKAEILNATDLLSRISHSKPSSFISNEGVRINS